jgi:predicted ferric reductase
VRYPSISGTGKVARSALISAMVLAQRNSLVTLLIGMPVDRAIVYHKLAGKLAGIAGLLHTAAFFLDPAFSRVYGYDMLVVAFTGQINTSGSVMMLLLAGICLSSQKKVRRCLFETFYYLHFVFIVGLVVGAFFHSGILVPSLTLVTWGSDLFIRKVFMARLQNPKVAHLTVISETVVQVSFPKTDEFAYNPGQYVYLAVPEISWFQWHPFSMSSAPHQQTVTLHIRKVGDWTSALFDHAAKNRAIEIYLEGPFGNLSVDIIGDRKYKSIMLISGGIGSKFFTKCFVFILSLI